MSYQRFIFDPADAFEAEQGGPLVIRDGDKLSVDRRRLEERWREENTRELQLQADRVRSWFERFRVEHREIADLQMLVTASTLSFTATREALNTGRAQFVRSPALSRRKLLRDPAMTESALVLLCLDHVTWQPVAPPDDGMALA